MELRSYDDFNIGGDVEEESEEKSLPSTNLLISISPKHNLNNNNITQKQHLNGNNFSPSENRRNIVVPEMQPWPPSPYEKVGYLKFSSSLDFIFWKFINLVRRFKNPSAFHHYSV